MLSTVGLLEMKLGNEFALLSPSDINSAMQFDIGSRERNESLREMKRDAFGRLSRAEVTWRANLIITVYFLMGAIPGDFNEKKKRETKEKQRVEASRMDDYVERAIESGVWRVEYNGGVEPYLDDDRPEPSEDDELYDEIIETTVQTFPPPRRSLAEIQAIAACVEIARKAVSELMAWIDAEINETARRYE